MTSTPFTTGWRFSRESAAEPVDVRLPHDAMIGEPRSGDAGTGNHGGYFPGGVYRYVKDWTVPADAAGREHTLFFEGVYGRTTVTVDGVTVGTCASGYREFSVPLGRPEPGSTARIEVEVDNSATPNSRWYTGAGIYRPVRLVSTPATHLSHDGVSVVTREIADGSAQVEVRVQVDGPAEALVAAIALSAAGRTVVDVRADVVDGVASTQLSVPDVRAWSAEHPYLYDAVVQLVEGADVVDEQTMRVGLRTVEIDAEHGLRVNAEPVLLRGACVHHDNGILGAATFAAAERRRARILKDAGYNAVRSSHHPLSRAFLDACDEVGLYVMDELTDVWFAHKTRHDGAERFEELWPDDARAMVAKDRNRPSVIMYSIGNEVAESSTERGVDAARRIHAFVKELDPTRPTTMAVNLLLNLMATKGKSGHDRETPSAGTPKRSATSTAANLLTARLGRVMELVSRLPAADRASRDAFAQVDVAGYNYAYGRYRSDRRRYPDRVVVGSESMPGDLPRIWSRVESVPGVIGDFMWTGWDYLGESGIGVWSYGDEPGGLNKPYPALLAGPGAFDITGLPGAPAFLAQAVWDRLEAPAIAVRPMDRAGQRANRTPWRSSDAIPSWSWGGQTGRAEIEVYSADDQVELVLNGRSLGRKRAGRAAGFVARFRVDHEPGELVAVGYRGGIETGRSTLRSARNARLTVRPEEPTLDGADEIAFVWIEVADADGTVESAADDVVSVTVDGPAELVALGSADPAPSGSFLDDSRTTYRGRALAVVRGTGEPGTVTVSATSGRHGAAAAQLTAAAVAATTVPLQA